MGTIVALAVGRACLCWSSPNLKALPTQLQEPVRLRFTFLGLFHHAAEEACRQQQRIFGLVQIVVVRYLYADQLPYAIGASHKVADLLVTNTIPQNKWDVFQSFFSARFLVGDALVAVAVPVGRR